jgi:hypothetical protein
MRRRNFRPGRQKGRADHEEEDNVYEFFELEYPVL